VVTNEFADAHPDAVATWLEQQDRAVQLINDDLDAASAAVAAELDIDAAEAARQLGELIFVTAADQVGADYLGGGLATNLFAAAQFNERLGEIDGVQAEAAYRDGVDSAFAEKVASG
jgi:taurine transport system substrate-binding protein